MLGKDGITLEQALRELGQNAEEVYQNLKDRGVKGVRRDYKCCPVSNYLRACGFICPAATPVTISIGDWQNKDKENETIPCPPGVASFIRAFDSCVMYTDLLGEYQPGHGRPGW